MRALLAQAEAGADWVMPGFTHLQTAQPVTWGHHMMAYVEMFGRDRPRPGRPRADERKPAWRRCAGRDTAFPIDREMTAAALGFDRPMRQLARCRRRSRFRAGVSGVARSAPCISAAFAEELVIWSSAQFRFVTLSDRFSTGSSIMPQKKNPDAAELIRAKIGRIFGANVALMTVMKGLPLAYSKDMQEDKEQVFDAADNWMLALAAMDRHGARHGRQPRRPGSRGLGGLLDGDRSGRLAGARNSACRSARRITSPALWWRWPKAEGLRSAGFDAGRHAVGLVRERQHHGTGLGSDHRGDCADALDPVGSRRAPELDRPAVDPGHFLHRGQLRPAALPLVPVPAGLNLPN
jgi:hypothetical protein